MHITVQREKKMFFTQTYQFIIVRFYIQQQIWRKYNHIPIFNAGISPIRKADHRSNN